MAQLDLLSKGVRIFGSIQFIAEGWKAAEADVQYDAKGPDVYSASVFALPSLSKNLRGNI